MNLKLADIWYVIVVLLEGDPPSGAVNDPLDANYSGVRSPN